MSFALLATPFRAYLSFWIFGISFFFFRILFVCIWSTDLILVFLCPNAIFGQVGVLSSRNAFGWDTSEGWNVTSLFLDLGLVDSMCLSLAAFSSWKQKCQDVWFKRIMKITWQWFWMFHLQMLMLWPWECQSSKSWKCNFPTSCPEASAAYYESWSATQRQQNNVEVTDRVTGYMRLSLQIVIFAINTYFFKRNLWSSCERVSLS